MLPRSSQLQESYIGISHYVRAYNSGRGLNLTSTCKPCICVQHRRSLCVSATAYRPQRPPTAGDVTAGFPTPPQPTTIDGPAESSPNILPADEDVDDAGEESSGVSLESNKRMKRTRTYKHIPGMSHKVTEVFKEFTTGSKKYIRFSHGLTLRVQVKASMLLRGQACETCPKCHPEKCWLILHFEFVDT